MFIVSFHTGTEKQRKKVPINKVADTNVTLQSVSYDEYDVKLTATNNENITSTSSIVTANFLPSKSIHDIVSHRVTSRSVACGHVSLKNTCYLM